MPKLYSRAVAVLVRPCLILLSDLAGMAPVKTTDVDSTVTENQLLAVRLNR